ncbi:MAG TPA: glycosyltransferase family 39 protein [Acidimicrobiales bacterium]|nr:glycosyltransferase family 39 protein [Acidimicrobiales bacterium]
MESVSIGTASPTPPETEAPTDGPDPDPVTRSLVEPLAADTGTERGDPPEGKPFSRGFTLWLGAAVAVVLVVALVLRFWTRSDLWLDEALTVNIAKQPLHTLPSYLKRDGAPPLFYVLLHFWMGIFGDSDLAVRSLSGVIGVVTVPLVWLAGRRIGGRTAGWAAMLLVATSPFAVRYDTETRMYALVALLTVLGYLAMTRALTRPRPGNLVAVAVVTSLLLYSHYWSFYLLGTAFVWLAWQAWRGRPTWRRNARFGMVAMAVGALTFVPWVPTFLYQSAHTGTPWATPANFAAMVNAVASFAGGGSNQGRALALIYFALIGLALFGIATDRRHIELDIRTRPLGRPLGWIVLGTLAAAIAGGFLSNSAFDARYASVVFVPVVLLVAIGLTTFLDRRVRTGILAVAIVAGLVASFANITTNRTQAGKVAAAMSTRGQPGDIVAYCPDQLGPAVDRLLPPGRYQQITFPRDTGPAFVNWVDYAKASHAGSPTSFAARLEAMSGSTQNIFLVWAPGYQTLGSKCEQIVDTLQTDPNYQVHSLVVGNNAQFYQPMYLYEFVPTNH